MSDVMLVLLGAVAGIGVGVLTQTARRRATWPWRIAAGGAALAGVVAFFAATDGTYLIPMAVFVVIVVASYAFDRRDVRTAD